MDCEASILDEYEVKILPAAFRQLESIYAYITENLCAKDAAKRLISKLEDAIQSLETMPERGAVRRTKAFAGREYRQLFVGNFIILYRIHEPRKQVIIVAVRYARQDF
ncbi:MAG: type II toxin-antitoxin system RelE/ParE family toxin [Schwartzia sp.]|nr:type II toxin-antitoxin system RelE/ParE family toxin [Schwartzia sp. (in: firmicutes)]